MNKHIDVGLNEVEFMMVKELQRKLGFRQVECIRQAIRSLYLETFPNVFKQKQKDPVKEEPKTAEEYCQQEGGKLIFRDGQRYCLIVDGALERELPVPEKLI